MIFSIETSEVLVIYLMKEILKLIGFVLVAVGFTGLMLTEFVFDWRSSVTIAFAATNAAGLVILGFAHWGIGKRSKK